MAAEVRRIHVIGESGIMVRLQGIAAPETHEPGGTEATAFLQQLAQGKAVRCVLDGTRTQEPEIGICYIDGRDIAGSVIKAGLARDCPAFSGGRYRAIEKPEAMKLPSPDYCSTKKSL